MAAWRTLQVTSILGIIGIYTYISLHLPMGMGVEIIDLESPSRGAKTKKGGWCNIWTWGSLWRRLWHLGDENPDVFGPGMSFEKMISGSFFFLRRVGFDPLSLRLEWFDGRDLFFLGDFYFWWSFLLFDDLEVLQKIIQKNWEPWVPDKHVVKRRGKIQHLEWFGNSQLVQDFRHEQSGNKKKARGVYIHQDYWQLLVIIVLLFSACAFQSHLCHYVPDALPPLKLYIAPQNWWLEGNPFVVCSG